MNQEEAQTRMKELEQQIAELPVGSITRKTVNGKIYFYQRWSENGKRREGEEGRAAELHHQRPNR